MSNGPPNLLTLAEVEALPALGPWHVAACHTHVPGGQFYRPGEPAPTCVAVRDAAGRPVESPQAALELQAAAPALRSTALALYVEVERLRAETFAAFGEQTRAEGERDAARRELSEIRTALGDLVNAGGNKGLPETVAGLAEYAMRTSDRLIEVSEERDKLRETVAVYEAGGEWPADLGAPLQCGTLGAVIDPLPEKAKT